MAKQGIIIGLGQFGMSVAKAMAEKRVEIIAVDLRPELVRKAAEFAADALCFDATDEEALARLAPAERDVSVCAIGDESREASIICTALLRQMGSPRVIARANSDLQARILRLVGAHEVVNPERAFGERFASRIVYEEIVGELPLGKDLVITEFHPPPALVGRTLAELKLPRRFGVTVVAVRREGQGTVVDPDPSMPLDETDIIVVVSREGAVEQLIDRI